MSYVTSGQVGIDLTDLTTGTTTDGANAKFTLGTMVEGNNGTRWLYCQAAGAIRQYDVVAIDENYQAVSVTSALAGAGHQVGFAQIAFADNDLGWIPIRGSLIYVKCAQSCAADALLYVGTTGLSAGVVDDASATGRVTLQGVVLITAGATGTTNRQVIATNPIYLNV